MKLAETIPVFDLQTHHHRVEVPTEFDMRDLARKYEVFPLKIIQQNNRRSLLLAMRDPFNQKALADVQFRAGMSIQPVQADHKDIQWLIQTHFFGRKLTPLPSVADENSEITHNMFEQLEMSNQAQREELPRFNIDNLFSEKPE